MSDIELDSIGSTEAFGSLTLGLTVSPATIPSAEVVSGTSLGYRYAGTGTIYMGSIGNTVPRVTLKFPKRFNWNVNAAVSRSKAITWNVGTLPNYWFRVMGDCQELSCPVSPVNMPQKCGSYYLQMVLATTPEEVCQKLSRSNFIWRIAEMSRYSTPADNAIAVAQDAAGLIDINCNTLIPVPHCQYADCVPFCIHTDAVVEMGAEMTSQNSFFRYAGTGGVRMGGSASPGTRPDTYRGTGGISISGSAGVVSSHYHTQGSGGILISGSADVKCNYWKAQGSGGMSMGGSAVVTSNRFRYAGTGGMSMGGAASSRVKLAFASSGLSSIGPTFSGITIGGSVVEKVKYYYKTAGSGGIVMSGEGVGKSSYFAAAGSGGITMGGSAVSKSPSYHTAGSGGITISGSANSRLILHAAGSGGIVMGGSAPQPATKFRYAGTGGIHISGEGLVPNHIQGSGGIHMGGSAVISSTWKGLYVDEWGFDCYCENLEPIFGDGESIPFVANTTLLTRCGVENMPQILQVSHNFGDADILGNFLTRNGLTLPSIFDLYYHRLTDTWRGNYHFIGRADETTNERWDIMVEWGCTSEVYGLSNAPVWKFGFYLTRRNEQTTMDFDTRIVTFYDLEPLATRFNNDGVDLDMRFNPFTKRPTVVSANATVQSSVFFDGIGLFRSPQWRTTPFQFRLKPIGEFRKILRYDILPIFPKAGEFDLT